MFAVGHAKERHGQARGVTDGGERAAGSATDVRCDYAGYTAEAAGLRAAQCGPPMQGRGSALEVGGGPHRAVCDCVL